jgi:sentrin-specific protease 7
MLSPEDQKRTHVFSSFFYKRLTTRTTPQAGLGAKYVEDPKLSPAEKRHHRVKGWTKSVDLFSKDFIIIPINEKYTLFFFSLC